MTWNTHVDGHFKKGQKRAYQEAVAETCQEHPIGTGIKHEVMSVTRGKSMMTIPDAGQGILHNTCHKGKLPKHCNANRPTMRASLRRLRQLSNLFPGKESKEQGEGRLVGAALKRRRDQP